MANLHMYFNRKFSSSLRATIKHVDRGYAIDRHEVEQIAKPWSELFEPMGPGLKSSTSPTGETITRSLDRDLNSSNQDRKDIDSSTPDAEYYFIDETTTFLNAALRYLKDIFLLTQHS
ncbi:MAG: hypothetical protein ACFFE1_08610 [Candidatus Thorarchaeota archaeon]